MSDVVRSLFLSLFLFLRRWSCALGKCEDRRIKIERVNGECIVVYEKSEVARICHLRVLDFKGGESGSDFRPDEGGEVRE